VLHSAPAPPFAPLLQLRIRSPAKSIATCTCIAEKGAWWGVMCYKGLVAKAAPQNQLQLAECTCRKKKLRGGLRGAKRGWHIKAPTSPHPIKIGCIRCDYFLRYFSNGSLKLIIRDIIMGSSRILQEFNKKNSMIFLLKSHCGLVLIDPDNI